MEGYLKSQCLPKNSPHGALMKKRATRQHTLVSYQSVSQEHGSNEVWFIHQEDGRRLRHRLGECLPNPHQGCATYVVHPQV